MGADPHPILGLLGDIIETFELGSLRPSLGACEALAGEDSSVDVAVLGQFKSGKSSLLNALLGAEIFPVSVLPATAVITRASGGRDLAVRVRHLDGRMHTIPLEQIGAFVTEAGNPRNHRQVKVVDVFTPAMSDWPGIRVVAPLRRRTRCLSWSSARHQGRVWLIVSPYNWVLPHKSLRQGRQPCTPAMALGLADQVWSYREYIWLPVHQDLRGNQLMEERIEQLLTSALPDTATEKEATQGLPKKAKKKRKRPAKKAA